MSQALSTVSSDCTGNLAAIKVDCVSVVLEVMS